MTAKNYIITYTGLHMNPFEPDMSQIDIRDIAHALSLLTRSNGHFDHFFSVGQHSIQCCREAMARHYVPELCLALLLHNASEAYMGDIARPLKPYLTMYIQVEEQLKNMIYEKYLGFVPEGENAALIKGIDDACLYYENLHFRKREQMIGEPVMLSRLSFKNRNVIEVEQEFLDLYHLLISKIAGEA